MLNVRDIGKGPAVLILGGCPVPADHYRPLAEALAPKHRVLLPDLPGYGRSPAIEPYTLAAAETALIDAVTERGIRQCAIIGHSLGAYRALAIAVSGRIDVPVVFAMAGFANLPQDVRDMFRQFAGMVRTGFDGSAMMVQRMLSPKFAAEHPEACADVAKWTSATTAAVLAGEMEATVNCEDLLPRLRSSQLRCVARVGSLDVATPVAFSQEIAASVRGGVVEVVPEVGHALLIEDFAQTVASVSRAIA